MSTPADQLDELLATTFQRVKPVLADNITREVPLLAALNAKSSVGESGGTVLRRPILFAFNSTTKSYSGYDLIDTTPQGGMGYAEYQWRQYAGSVTISGEELLKNAGPAQIIDLLQAKFEQLDSSQQDAMNVMLWADGTGNANKDFLGIQAIISASSTLGGIDPSTETWWKSKVVTGAISLATTAGVKSLNSIKNSLRLVKSRPDLCFTTQANFESYEALAVPNIRFEDLTLADLGFEVVAFKGAEVMFEDNVPAAAWYFINSKYLEFIKHSSRWMMNRGFQEPVNQDAKVALVLSAGNLITGVRRAHGVATNVS